jgi:hypothetical protein
MKNKTSVSIEHEAQNQAEMLLSEMTYQGRFLVSAEVIGNFEGDLVPWHLINRPDPLVERIGRQIMLHHSERIIGVHVLQGYMMPPTGALQIKRSWNWRGWIRRLNQLSTRSLLVSLRRVNFSILRAMRSRSGYWVGTGTHDHFISGGY